MSHSEPERGGQGCAFCGESNGHDIACPVLIRIDQSELDKPTHHPSCTPNDKDLVWHCNQCGLNESASDIEEEHDMRGRVEANLALQVQELTRKLTKARELLFAVQPFCEAWACFDLADDIKDFLDGRKEEHGKEKGERPPNSPGA